MRYGTRYGSRIARDMTAGPPGGVPSASVERARDERIADFIAAGYARQEAEAARAYAEANRLTPAQERAAGQAKFMAEAKRRAEVRKATRQWEAQHGPALTGVPEREPGSLERGRALWADQKRRRP